MDILEQSFGHYCHFVEKLGFESDLPQLEGGTPDVQIFVFTSKYRTISGRSFTLRIELRESSAILADYRLIKLSLCTQKNIDSKVILLFREGTRVGAGARVAVAADVRGPKLIGLHSIYNILRLGTLSRPDEPPRRLLREQSERSDRSRLAFGRPCPIQARKCAAVLDTLISLTTAVVLHPLKFERDDRPDLTTLTSSAPAAGCLRAEAAPWAASGLALGALAVSARAGVDYIR
ncbi:hypothetical protein EVAR_94262_1 [Eumeta japonica]|uniref:Uncharacterized protein n=1 Tax=Eumeta variegata TaxID=151549 RepID=A0A4C1UF03_EUMVA|nr:hypothetical protein EVAR_94262_1 [Eumeta japonica]